MDNNLNNVKRSIALRKQNLVQIFGGKCCICGFNKYITALEFHHINPQEKSFSLTGSGLMKNMPDQLAELKKCILVCANCHRGIHYHDLLVPNDWQSYYQEEVAEKLLTEYFDKKQKHLAFCEECNEQVSGKGRLCVKCASKKRQTIERPSREELKNLIRTNSFLALGRQFGVSDNAIRKWCIAYNLPAKVSDIKSITDKDWEQI